MKNESKVVVTARAIYLLFCVFHSFTKQVFSRRFLVTVNHGDKSNSTEHLDLTATQTDVFKMQTHP